MIVRIQGAWRVIEASLLELNKALKKTETIKKKDALKRLFESRIYEYPIILDVLKKTTEVEFKICYKQLTSSINGYLATYDLITEDLQNFIADLNRLGVQRGIKNKFIVKVANCININDKVKLAVPFRLPAGKQISSNLLASSIKKEGTKAEVHEDGCEKVDFEVQTMRIKGAHRIISQSVEARNLKLSKIKSLKSTIKLESQLNKLLTDRSYEYSLIKSIMAKFSHSQKLKTIKLISTLAKDLRKKVRYVPDDYAIFARKYSGKTVLK
jgi:hypothetical protein